MSLDSCVKAGSCILSQYALMMLHEVEPEPHRLITEGGIDPAILGVNCRRLSDGRTCLHCAAANGHVSLVVSLLARGANPTLR